MTAVEFRSAMFRLTVLSVAETSALSVNKRSRLSTSWKATRSSQSDMTAALIVFGSKWWTDAWRCISLTIRGRISCVTVSRSHLSADCSKTTPAFAKATTTLSVVLVLKGFKQSTWAGVASMTRLLSY
ncbi:hypothetical protein AJ87_08215 [Rhizobium yanglingense]|nr:hypothetical protein AJ87_08215 [Rhizobium yanglingense]